jgi:hypothetical protein
MTGLHQHYQKVQVLHHRFRVLQVSTGLDFHCSSFKETPQVYQGFYRTLQARNPYKKATVWRIGKRKLGKQGSLRE